MDDFQLTSTSRPEIDTERKVEGMVPNVNRQTRKPALLAYTLDT